MEFDAGIVVAVVVLAVFAAMAILAGGRTTGPKAQLCGTCRAQAPAHAGYCPQCGKPLQ
jgi:predicted amidophosphoribosyltransferase